MSVRSLKNEIRSAMADGLVRKAEAERIVAEAEKGGVTAKKLAALKEFYGTVQSTYLYETYETADKPLRGNKKSPVMTMEAGPVMYGFLTGMGVSAAEMRELANAAMLFNLQQAIAASSGNTP